MSRVDAQLFRDHTNWQRNTVTLMVRQRMGTMWAYLLPDGTWRETEDGTSLAEIGITLPADAIEAIARAIQDFQGHASHADTEARVLREWLTVERARVDAALVKP